MDASGRLYILDKALGDRILGHNLDRMDEYYITPTEEDLGVAMERYTDWLDAQMARKAEADAK